MIPGFEDLVEQRIKQAQKEGQFDNLKGTHKPLKFEDENVPEEFRLGHKILKNSGFLPPEVELRKKIGQTQQLLEESQTGTQEYTKITKKLNYLMTKLNVLRGDRPISPMMTDVYHDNIIKKMS